MLPSAAFPGHIQRRITGRRQFGAAAPLHIHLHPVVVEILEILNLFLLAPVSSDIVDRNPSILRGHAKQTAALTLVEKTTDTAENLRDAIRIRHLASLLTPFAAFGFGVKEISNRILQLAHGGQLASLP